MKRTLIIALSIFASPFIVFAAYQTIDPTNVAITGGTITGITDLAVADGGTGLSTFGGTNHVLYTTSAGTLASEAAFTYDASADRITAVNASTTGLSVNSTNIQGNGSATSYISPIGGFTVPSGATSTWNGTTTIYVGPAPYAMTISEALCSTDAGTLKIQLVHGSTNMQMLLASTTVGTQAVSSNNTITKGEVLKLQFGTPATSPTTASCTFRGPRTGV